MMFREAPNSKRAEAEARVGMTIAEYFRSFAGVKRDFDMAQELGVSIDTVRNWRRMRGIKGQIVKKRVRRVA